MIAVEMETASPKVTREAVDMTGHRSAAGDFRLKCLH